MDNEMQIVNFQLLLLDYKEFLRTVKLDECSNNNLTMLMKITAYLRTRVLPVYQDISQNIRAKSLCLQDKNKFLNEDVQKLKDMTEEIVTDYQRLWSKYSKIERKQCELSYRAETLMYETKKRYYNLSNAEQEFVSDIDDINEKMKDLSDSIDLIKEKKNALKVQEDHWNIKSDQHFLHEAHVRIIRESLDSMSLDIRRVIDKISLVETQLDKDDIKLPSKKGQ